MAKKKRAPSTPHQHQDALLRAFEAWPGREGDPADIDVLRMVLDFRADHLDVNPALWKVSDLSHLLLGLFPRKVVLDEDEIPDVVPAIGDFLGFLAETGRMDAASDPLDELNEALEEIEQVFPGLMSDEGTFGMAKTLAMAMEGEGVDMTNPSALEAWITAFNARPEAQRLAMIPNLVEGLVGDLVGDPMAAFGQESLISLPDDIPIPPVRIAPEEELSRAAGEVPAMGRLRRFVNWVGNGRGLTDAGRLKLRDVPELVEVLGLDPLPPNLRLRSSSDLAELDWTYVLAEVAELVEVGTRLTATNLGSQMGLRPLDAWQSVFEGLLEVGVATWFRGRAAWQPSWAEMLDDGLPDLLVLAYLNGREGLPTKDVVELLWTEIASNVPGATSVIGESLRPGLASDVGRLVEALANFGIIEPGPALALSPLGVWAVHTLLVKEGHPAPSVDYGPDDDPSALLAYWATLDPDHVGAEIDGWLAGRSAEEAVTLLAGAARADPMVRGLFFFVLERLGPEAANAVSLLVDDLSLGHYALVWRIEQGLAEEGSLPEEALHRMMVDQLVGMLAAGGPEAVIEALNGLGPPQEQAMLLQGLGKVATSEAMQVLKAVASTHSDPVVTRAARKATFRNTHAPAAGSKKSPSRSQKRSGRRFR